MEDGLVNLIIVLELYLLIGISELDTPGGLRMVLFCNAMHIHSLIVKKIILIIHNRIIENHHKIKNKFVAIGQLFFIYLFENLDLIFFLYNDLLIFLKLNIFFLIDE